MSTDTGGKEFGNRSHAATKPLSVEQSFAMFRSARRSAVVSKCSDSTAKAIAVVHVGAQKRPHATTVPTTGSVTVSASDEFALFSASRKGKAPRAATVLVS